MRQLRVGNCSGFYGDRFSAMREMLEGGDLDVLTGDYLAELTMLILGRDQLKDPSLGYARTFVRQLQDCLGLALEQGVAIVANAGGLNPAGLAARLGETGRVQAAGVRHQTHLPLQSKAQTLLGLPEERACVPEGRVPHPIFPEDQHRELGEVVAGEYVEGAALEHLAHRREPVAVEARAVADEQRAGPRVSHAGHDPRRAGPRTPAPGRASAPRPARRRPGRCRRGARAG